MGMRCWVPAAVLLIVAPSIPAVEDRDGPLPDGAVMVLGSRKLRPDGPVAGLAFSPDGRSLVTVGPDADIQVWDVAGGRELRRILRPGGARFVHFQGGGKTILVGGRGRGLSLFDPVGGVPRGEWLDADDSGLTAVACSADGRTVAAAQASGVVVLWDAASGKIRHTLAGREGQRPRIPLTPDGKHFIAAHRDHSLHFVDVLTGKDVRAFEMGPPGEGPHPFAERTRQVILSPDGKLLAYGGEESPVTVCSVDSGKVVIRINAVEGGVEGLTFAPGGRLLAVATHAGARLYSVASGKELRCLRSVPLPGCKLTAFAPDGRTLAVVGIDGGLRLWDALEGRELHPLSGHPGSVQPVLFLDGGKRLLSSGSDGRLVVWDLATGREVAEHRGPPYNGGWLILTPDDKGVQTFGIDGWLYTWQPGAAWERGDVRLPKDFTGAQSLSSSGRYRATFGPDSKLRLEARQDKARGERVLPLPPGVGVEGLYFSPDERRLASRDSDNQVRVWDCASGRLLQTLRGTGSEPPRLGAANHIDFAADGRSVLVNTGGLHLIEVSSGQERARLPFVPSDPRAFAWSSDARLVARVHEEDRTVRVYDTGAGRELSPLNGRQGKVEALAFSRDGRLLATGGANGLIVVWKMPAPQQASELSAARRAALWHQLADGDAASAARAIASLQDAPGPAVELIRERLDPGRTHPDRGRLEKWIADLDSDVFAERETASRELAEAGADAEPLLRRALEKRPSVEVRRRLEELLDKRKDSGRPSERLRAVRAIEALERIGTPAAKQLLAELARQARDPALAEEIEASLLRLGERP